MTDQKHGTTVTPRKGTASRPMPLDAVLVFEHGVLGAAIVDPTGRQARIAAEYLEPTDFLSSLDAAVFRSIRALVARDCLPLDYSSVIAEMMAQHTFEQYANGYSFVSSLCEGVVLGLPMSRRIQQLRAAWKAYKEARDAE